MYCYASHNYRDFSHAGNIAKSYNERILESMGFKNVAIRQTNFSNKVIGFSATLAGVLAIPFNLHQGDYLLLQYPIKKYFTLICRIAHFKGAKVIALVHDLGSCRRKKITEEEEMYRLANADCLILPNESMEQWVLERGYKGTTAIHHMHDYICEAQAQPHSYEGGRLKIMYAGALPRKKNGFLYTLAENPLSFDLELYGRGFDAKQIKNGDVHYHGFTEDTDLITKNTCHFGLVWDGGSLDCCDGPYGEYLKLNNPFKTSLYIRCNLPVIVWEKAAIAPFVKQKGIGITVSSLNDLDKALAGITPERYAELQANVQAWSKELQKGTCTRNAVIDALASLKETYKFPEAGKEE